MSRSLPGLEDNHNPAVDNESDSESDTESDDKCKDNNKLYLANVNIYNCFYLL